MKIVELLAVGIRILGIYLVLQILMSFSEIYQLYQFTGDAGIAAYPYVLVAEVIVLGLVAFALIKFPITISRKLIPNDPDEKLNLPNNAEKLIAVAFVVIGVYILTWSVPDLIFNFLWLAYSHSQDFGYEQNFQEALINQAATILEIGIGLYLVLGSRGLSRVLWLFRNTGI